MRETNLEGKKILVVEDETDIAELLLLHLHDMHACASRCADGISAWQRLQDEDWDLLLLDLKLPGMDGLEICRRLRAAGNRVPILMITAKTSELDRVLGLEVGADDYVLKPFSVMEVMARIRALLRRVALDRTPLSQSLSAVCGNLSIDEARRSVKVADANLELTPREFDLLLFFARSPGQVFRRAQLLDQVWGFGHEGYEHTVNSHINRLRSKLLHADPEHEYIVTVWGVGYKFNDELALTHTEHVA